MAKTPNNLLETAHDQVQAKAVYIRAETGRLPLEWDPETGRKGCIDHDVRAADGSIIEKVRYRAIETDGSWKQMLDMSDPEDVEFLERVRDFIARSRDPRIASKKVRIVEGGNAEPEPLPRYESRKPETIIEMLGLMMDDSDEANRELLLKVARYELQRDGGPRAEILAFVDEYESGVGDESADELVGEV